jgi:murein DD-endopeptidase MepM/ murein hydrolase activator NlpD
MSTPQRGRHRAARHAAPKKSLPISGKHAGVLFGVAGIGTVFVTPSAVVAGDVQAGDLSVMDTPVVNLASDTPVVSAVEVQAVESRAQAASRSENRQTLQEAEVVAAAATSEIPVSDPSAVIDITPSVSGAERTSLRAFAGSDDQLESLIQLTSDQKVLQAESLFAQQQALIAAREKADADAAAAKEKADAEARAVQERAQVKVTEAQVKIEQIRKVGVIEVPIVGSYQLSARYGQRGNLWEQGWHTGLDFRVKTGTTVVSAANGEIISAGWAGAYGYRIEIDHGNGFVTSYSHLSKILKSSGKVAAGTVIGNSGSTGNTTGPHLHFEVTKDGEFMNPTNWLWAK